jgi:hypothetical protein
MASARLKPRTNIAHVRGGPKRRSLAARAVHRSVGSNQHMNQGAQPGGSLHVFGAALLVSAVVSLAVITGFMA